ncbi:MAG TPA: NosD domain-containing protein [Pyrinomonadaceae bacterium]|nr:NosD domain-containing protein [Pyrinomonadaceae bacterium]
MTKKTRITTMFASLLVLTALIQNPISAQRPISQLESQKISSRGAIRNLATPVTLPGFLASSAPSLSPASVLPQDGPGVRPVTRATTITESGSYVLIHDIEIGAPSTAIVIAANNVSLNLNGHALTGPGNKQGVGIDIANVNSISIHNGTIAGFGTGIRVASSHDVRAESLQIRGEDGGGPPPGEVGVLVLNSRAVVLKDNSISRTFLGIFVRGGGSGGNRIAGNTLVGGQNGQIGICYNPDGSVSLAGPKGDLVYNNLVSRFNIGIQTSLQTLGNIFRENNIAFFQQAINEVTPGSNVFEDNTAIAIVP